MKAIQWRDEKLYRIRARDYGDLIHRSFGVVIHSLAKGTAVAVLVVFVLFTPRLFTSRRDWYILFPPLALVCSIWAGVSSRSLYICEIEIRPDRLVRHSGGNASAIERTQVHSIAEEGCWTLFGWVHGLVVRGKGASIFVPLDHPEYDEIKSRLNGWHPVES
jgi:hypothetical protein